MKPTRRGHPCPVASAGIGLAVLALLLAGGVAAQPPAFVVDPGRSRIGFHATSRFMDGDGTFARVGGEIRVDPEHPQSGTARVTVEVASLDTGIGLRDRHLRSTDFFDVTRYPTARFDSSSIERVDGQWLVGGKLTIHGVTRAVTVPVSLTRTAEGIRIVGELSIDRHDFGISYRSFLNPIGAEVRVSFDLRAVPR